MPINRTLFGGTVTKDPFVKDGTKQETGKKWTLGVVSIQHTEKVRKRDGSFFPKKTTMKVKAFGKAGEAIAACREGDVVVADGKLTLESYDDKRTGEKKWDKIIEADTFRNLSKDGASVGDVTRASTPTAADAAATESNDLPEDDEVPF